MQVKLVKLSEDAIFPNRFAHANDAGFDFITPVNFKLFSEQSILIKTQIGWEVLNDSDDKKYMMKLESKSGLSIKYKIRVCGGVIDEDYRGCIGVHLHNFGTEVIEFKRGDKIAQGIIHEIPVVDLVYATKFNNENTSRGTGAYGSTGK